jgi:S1-C subfamily serine protease
VSYIGSSWTDGTVGWGEGAIDVLVINPSEPRPTSWFALDFDLFRELEQFWRRYVSMNKGVLRVLGWVAVLTLVLVIGAVAGGGAVYAMTQLKESKDQSIQLAVPEEFDPEPGIVVASVVTGEAADEAGVERGDILLEVDGESVDSVPDLVTLLREYEVGDDVELVVRHGDDERTLTATLGELDGSPYLGLVPCAPMPGVEQHMVVRVRGVGPGAVIASVEENSPASKAGLQPGDVILSVDGQELDAENSLADVIAAHEPGDTVALTVERPGQDEDEESQELDVEVELAEHPEEEGVAYLGVRYRASSRISHLPGMEEEELPFQRRHLEPFFDGQIPEFPGEGMIQGAVVQSVTEDSPAELAGLAEGDVITAVDGETVTGPGDVVEAIAAHAPGDRVTLTLVSSEESEEGEAREVEVELAEHPDEEDKAYLGVQIGGFIHVRRFRSEDGESLDRESEEFEYNFDFDWEMPHDGFHLELPPLDELDLDDSFPFGADEAGCCLGGV